MKTSPTKPRFTPQRAVGILPPDQTPKTGRPAHTTHAEFQWFCRRDVGSTLAGRVGGQERGSAVVIFLALLAIMLILVAANGRTVALLKLELQLIEHKQVQRLERSQTIAVPSSSRETTPALAVP